jgi:peptidyl-prolyl cis-trans isomerase B (cyclophilin B)
MATEREQGAAEEKLPLVTLTLENGAVITAVLYPETAPNTVRNFIQVARTGYYTGKTFHRAIPGFMIQGGSANGDGTGGYAYAIKGEFTANGFANALKHTRGVLSMARTNDPNSASTQFFIMHGEAPWLDGKYAAFGRVTAGMEAADAIATAPVRGDALIQPVKIREVTVETYGVEYGAAEPA